MSKKPPTNRPNGSDEPKARKPKVRRSIEARIAEMEAKKEKLLQKQWMEKLKEDESEEAEELREAIAQVKQLRNTAEVLDELDEHKLADEVRQVADSLQGDIQRDIKKHAAAEAEASE